ncbi:MAG: TonB-dependent receptor, partial [Lysobacteraceae bacterium]
MMLHRRKFVQFIFQMTIINFIDEGAQNRVCQSGVAFPLRCGAMNRAPLVRRRKCSTMATMLRLSRLACACAALFALHAGCGQAAVHAAQDGAAAIEPALEDYSLEQLTDIVVTSVSRQQGRLSSAPASVYVISGAEIARAGATTIPEALRLAPNLQVALAASQEYAISARGFSSQLANKLLVLIDGRSVYSPLFSGVFWEEQDVVLADVERIEVISGPGGTIWGTNAVNGVINIITKSAADTQGGLAQAHAGNRYAGAVLRHGKRLANGAFVRVYGKRDEAGASAGDTLEGGGVGRRQAGFRFDWDGADQSLTVSGDLHAGALRASSEPRTDFSGANLGLRFDARLAGDAALRLQAWVDQGRREQHGAGRHELDTVDLEAQYARRLGERHALTWGGGYRHARDSFENGPVLQLLPTSRRLRWANLFAQDEFDITPALRATAGLRVEHNDYTGTELLPSLRLAWDHAPGAMLWAAASRTVRAPARIDREMRLADPASLAAPGGPRYLVAGGPDMQSETARVLELGYRAQAAAQLSYAVTLFYSDYERLRTLEPQAGGAVFRNLGHGRARGVEAWSNWQAMRGWRLSAGAVVQDIATGVAASSADASARAGLATNDPRSYWQLRSSHELGAGVAADLLWRRVARLPQPAVPGYHELDVRIAWQARPD